MLKLSVDYKKGGHLEFYVNYLASKGESLIFTKYHRTTPMPVFQVPVTISFENITKWEIEEIKENV